MVICLIGVLLLLECLRDQSSLILHQISSPYLHNIFQFSKDITGHVSHNINRLFVPRVFTNYGKRSFFYRGAVLWNNLSLSVTEAATLPSFKKYYCTCNS